MSEDGVLGLKLGSTSTRSLSPDELRVHQQLHASASAKHQVFGAMIRAKREVEEKT